ncbi:MAG: YggS family pyridoxal phosphate-dependent enzyme [Flavobacteriales bacterium]|nr:YggS family pyridoxal phosphate-dependent enzyme [Flavobacteriales bacterium]
MSIANNIKKIKSELLETATLVAVSKTKPNEDILEAYNAGQRIFGENKVQELAQKHEDLPKDIEWHLIGHLQTNKVKFIAPFVSLIHAVDSLKLLKEINKQALKNNRVINCLLQVKIAKEDSKFGLNQTDAKALINSEELPQLKGIKIIGLMGMSTNTPDENQVQAEFDTLHQFYKKFSILNSQFSILSMGMSGDYKIALKQGSNMIRVGSTIFGKRNFN